MKNASKSTDMDRLRLTQRVVKLAGVPEKMLPKYRKLCGERYVDFLFHLPSGVINRRFIDDINTAPSGVLVVLDVQVIKHAGGYKRAPLRIQVEDAHNNSFELVFFNHGAWLKKAYPIGKTITVSGTLDHTLGGAQIVHPEAMPAQATAADTSGPTATYPLTAGVSQLMMRKAIDLIWQQIEFDEWDDWLDATFLKKKSWPPFLEALQSLHSPHSEEELSFHTPARERLAFDELLAWQMALMDARKSTKVRPGIPHNNAQNLQKKLIDALPFPLTHDQHTCIDEIVGDMRTREPMLRLVQGDVGSGKTFVAFMAALNAIESGSQVAMMAPTEILALQHFENAQTWLAPLGVRVGLLTGKLKAKEKRVLKEAVAAGEIDFLIGTHALIHNVTFHLCGLVVIDEQHRFGVEQRLKLGEQPASPDILVMTATPIPRTLALTFYGDMDISIIAEKPPGRTPIETRLFNLDRLHEIAASLQRVIQKGEQIYWVCPLVEESEKSDLAAATQRYETLHKLYGDNVGVLHGRMKGEEKADILTRFKNGDFKILVSTTVIEVGVDVPQATVMVIEHAERFGLAQLHQLRGRIGRGTLASHCMLLYGAPLGKFASERLNTLRESDDGFVLAEKDLELRGPGEALGTQQSGHAVTRLANLIEHRDLIPLARDMARALSEEKISPGKRASLGLLMRIFNKENAAKFLNAG